MDTVGKSVPIEQFKACFQNVVSTISRCIQLQLANKLSLNTILNFEFLVVFRGVSL